MFFAETARIRNLLFLLFGFGFVLNSLGSDKGEPHWAFVPPSAPPIPEVRDAVWAEGKIDRFILAKLESSGLTPAKRAEPRKLIRRAYFDLIGLPPSPEKVQVFVEDHSPDAFAKVIDELLESPRYGERWARHWLDVARYGDSNGGDENHAYPHAWRYRDYVINAFNRDLPYDVFLSEQLSGDLIDGDPLERSRRVTATGFLAIGTKILAEKDGIKKRADIVDEQIDTVSRAFMGMSVACARCHDHKFDPIPTADYYALAGIFHSTAIEDQSLERPEVAKQQAIIADRVSALNGELLTLEEKLSEFVDSNSINEWEAENFARGNVIIAKSTAEKAVNYISDPGRQNNFAEYDVEITNAGLYFVEFRYAAKDSRPGRLIVDGNKDEALPVLAKVTGGWNAENQRWIHEGQIELGAGKRVLRVESEPMMSHLDKIRLKRVRSAEQASTVLTQINKLKKEKVNLESDKDESYKVMAVHDGKVADARLNIRGDPHDKGEPVSRGFLSKIAPDSGMPCRIDSSGRLELAHWMTRPKHPLTARVMVNRIWHWHFGKGIVSSVDDFGTTGSKPTHPELLDFLAVQFVKNNWSMKSLHREIMLSNTYQLAVTDDNSVAVGKDPDNVLHWHHSVRRLEAESFRDAVLMVAGNLDLEPPSSPLVVKSQDPSPNDLAKNRQSYEQFPHRTVYLPVVRSHLYDLLTLMGFPNATTTVGKRSQTTVPTQALLMLNNPFLVRQAESLAKKIGNGNIKDLYLSLFSRPPSPKESSWAKSFLESYASITGTGRSWEALCHTLLISDEFLHVW